MYVYIYMHVNIHIYVTTDRHEELGCWQWATIWPLVLTFYFFWQGLLSLPSFPSVLSFIEILLSASHLAMGFQEGNCIWLFFMQQISQKWNHLSKSQDFNSIYPLTFIIPRQLNSKNTNTISHSFHCINSFF